MTNTGLKVSKLLFRIINRENNGERKLCAAMGIAGSTLESYLKENPPRNLRKVFDLRHTNLTTTDEIDEIFYP
jgi:hypothetical protein